MLFATSGDRVDYPDGREMPREDIHERILQAASQFCIDGSIKNWQAGTAFRAKETGLCEDWEYGHLDVSPMRCSRKFLPENGNSIEETTS